MRILTIFITLFVALSAHADVYKWTDSAGNTHYSDRPQPGVAVTEKIELPKGSRYSPPTVQPRLTPPRQSSVKGGGAAYQKVEIRQPANDATLRDNIGTVQVSVATTPGLQKGDAFQLYLDGEAIYDPYVYPTVKIPAVERGSHSLQAKVVDESGSVVASSDTITFHLHRHSANFNNRRPPR